MSEWFQDMLTLVAFPAIADVAPSVKCEAFKDLFSPQLPLSFFFSSKIFAEHSQAGMYRSSTLNF